MSNVCIHMTLIFNVVVVLSVPNVKEFSFYVGNFYSAVNIIICNVQLYGDSVPTTVFWCMEKVRPCYFFQRPLGLKIIIIKTLPNVQLVSDFQIFLSRTNSVVTSWHIRVSQNVNNY